MTHWHAGSRTTWWWVAATLGLALVVAYLAGQMHVDAVTARSIYFAATMTIGMVVGLWAWAWRTPPRMGVLMFWWPALVLAADLPSAFPDSSLASTIGIGLVVFGYILFAQMALSYPTGRLIPGRLAWIYVFILGYLAQAIQNVVNMLFWDLSDCSVCPPPTEPTLIYVGPASFSLGRWNDAWWIFIMSILPIGLFVLYRAYAQASPGACRSVGPVLATATFITCTSWIYLYVLVTDRFNALNPLSWVQTTGALVAALTALFGLGVTKQARGRVGDLVVELDRAGPGGARRALARAIGDPTLELALWLPERHVWVDEKGRELQLPTGPGRAVTLVGEDLAAIVHDPVLLDQPALLEAAGSAARLALENERLQAELRAQLLELRASRARIVRAADEERRRLERDLHDGAQQRLLAVGMALKLLKATVDGNEAASDLLDETDLEVQGALTELRELARGIHPAVLTDQGLEAAVRTLANRAPIPITIHASSERFPAHVETAIYFVVAEALANIARYAQASEASVTIERHGDLAVVDICDGGVGGAKLETSGSGLRGILDRVGALDGRLRLESPPGGGTSLRAEIPCGS